MYKTIISYILPGCLIMILFCNPVPDHSKDLPKPHLLPAPHLDSPETVASSLKKRESTHDFDTIPFSDQELANILWAAFGINRPENNGRTAPSSYNAQEVSLYVFLKQGTFVYNPKANSLDPMDRRDLRRITGPQTFLERAPLNLLYVTDVSKHKYDAKKVGLMFSSVSTGCIVQNVYLYCASKGFGTIVRGSIDRKKIARELGLNSKQKIIVAQTVGFPASSK